VGRAQFRARPFLGKLRLELIHPYPEQDPEEITRAQHFLSDSTVSARARRRHRIDREGEIRTRDPGLRELGAFGIKIRRVWRARFVAALVMKAIELVSSLDGSVTRCSRPPVHRRAAAAQDVRLEAQKKSTSPPRPGRDLRVRLTEPGVGSDPAAMETLAVPRGWAAWILNARSCGHQRDQAELMVVMARTPSKVTNGRKSGRSPLHRRDQLAAWSSAPCHFMG